GALIFGAVIATPRGFDRGKLDHHAARPDLTLDDLLRAAANKKTRAEFRKGFGIGLAISLIGRCVINTDMAHPISLGHASSGILIRPSAMETAVPPTLISRNSPRSTSPDRPIREGRPISTPCRRPIRFSPSASAPLARSCAASMAEAEPVAGSSGMPAVGENIRAR